MMTEPAPPQAVADAWQAYLEAQGDAGRALEACGGVADVGTPEGDRAYELDHAAEVAWERYHEAWHDAQGHPRAEPDAEAELEAG